MSTPGYLHVPLREGNKMFLLGNKMFLLGDKIFMHETWMRTEDAKSSSKSERAHHAHFSFGFPWSSISYALANVLSLRRLFVVVLETGISAFPNKNSRAVTREPSLRSLVVNFNMA